MEIPADLKYSTEHEWVRVDDAGQVTIGITDFAQDQLGDIVFLKLPEVGATFEQFDRVGEIESVKSVSELFTPIGGEVTDRNDLVLDQPELVNGSPYGEGWLWRVRLEHPAQLEALLDADAYRALVGEALT